MASPKGRGAQVRLDGDAQAAARGGLGQTLAATLEAKRLLEVNGEAADGTTLDGSTRTGVAAEDEVLAPGGVLVGGGGGATITFGQSAGTAAEGNDPRITGALSATTAATLYAPKASPAFTGTPTAPSPAAGANTLQIPTALWVRQEIASLINSAPGTLDTLSELAAALGSNPDFATTTAAALAAQAGRITTLEGQVLALQSSSAALPNLAAKLDHAQPVPATYFGMHHLGIADTPAPSVTHAGLRVWDNWGYNARLGNYTGGANDWPYAHTAAGTFQWDMFDLAMGTLATRGKTGDLMMTLLHHNGSKPAWVGAMGTADYYQRFGEYVTAIVARANGRIRLWGFVNEPNVNYSATVLYNLYLTAYPIIKAASSSFYVVGPEFQGNGSGNLDAFLALGGGAYCDIYGLHLYGKMQPDGIATDGAMPAEMDGYTTVLANRGQSAKAVWNTESSEHAMSTFGYGTRAEAERAYISQHMPLLWAKGADRYYYYAWDSDASITGKLNNGVGDTTHASGLNLAGTAWNLVRGWMLGKIVGAPTISGSNVSIPVTGSGGYVGRIAWAYKTTGTTTFTAGAFTRAIVADGTEYSIGGAVTSFPTGNLSVLLDNQAASGGATAYNGASGALSGSISGVGGISGVLSGSSSVAALSPGLMSSFPNIANAAWSGSTGATKTASQPDVNGGTTGEGMLEVANTGSHGMTSGQISKAASALTYTFTTRLKANGRTAVRLIAWRSDFGAAVSVDVNLTTGVMTAATADTGWANGTRTPTSRGNGWWDFQWVFTVPSTATGFFIQYEMHNPQGTSNYAGSTSAGILINGFSLTQP